MILLELELGIGLMAGSLPTLGKIFHIYDEPNRTSSYQNAHARQTIGGTPMKVTVPCAISYPGHSGGDTTALVPAIRGEYMTSISEGVHAQGPDRDGIAQEI